MRTTFAVGKLNRRSRMLRAVGVVLFARRCSWCDSWLSWRDAVRYVLLGASITHSMCPACRVEYEALLDG